MKRKNDQIDISKNELMSIVHADGTLTPEQFNNFLVEYLLGPDYYIGFSCGGAQARLIILTDILSKYSKRFNNELNELMRLEKEKIETEQKAKELMWKLPK